MNRFGTRIDKTLVSSECFSKNGFGIYVTFLLNNVSKKHLVHEKRPYYLVTHTRAHTHIHICKYIHTHIQCIYNTIFCQMSSLQWHAPMI